MIPYGKQFIDEEDCQAVSEVLKSDFLTTGPKVGEFEKEFAKKVNAKYAVAVSNGTAALHVACLAADLNVGDELITTPMTFAASANCALYCGAKPVFVDIRNDGLIDPTKIEEKITSKTKIIIPVHYAGLPCQMDQISNIAKKYNLIIIEDACHALGSKYKTTRIGDCYYSDMTVFSFHPVKHITTGEGGVITTNSEALYKRLLLFRTHGISRELSDENKDEGPWFYEMQFLGYNYRITDFQCALGLSQLKKLDKFITRRRDIAQKFNKAFDHSKYFEIIRESSDQFCAYHLYPIILKPQYCSKRKDIFNKLRQNGIGIQVHYIPVYFHPYYQSLGYKKGLCPISEQFYDGEISIPMYPAMKDEDIQEVIEKLNKIVESEINESKI